MDHFHLHCLVPAGALSFDERQWISARSKYLCIALIRKLIDPSAVPIEKIKETPAEMMLRLTGVDITCCPQCNKGKMVATIPLSKMINWISALIPLIGVFLFGCVTKVDCLTEFKVSGSMFNQESSLPLEGAKVYFIDKGKRLFLKPLI